MATRIPPFGIRLPDALKEQLRVAAFQHRRSMNAELVWRLQQTMDAGTSPAVAEQDGDYLQLPAWAQVQNRNAAAQPGADALESVRRAWPRLPQVLRGLILAAVAPYLAADRKPPRRRGQGG